jgi:hypothetical protein
MEALPTAANFEINRVVDLLHDKTNQEVQMMREFTGRKLDQRLGGGAYEFSSESTEYRGGRDELR